MEKKKYSNVRATLAMARASFLSIVRSPSAVVFSLAFPLVFIIVFGFIGGGGVRVDVGVDTKSDLSNPFFEALRQADIVNLITTRSQHDMELDLSKGRIDAMIRITPNPGSELPRYTIDLKTTEASVEKGNIFRSVLMNILYKANETARKAPAMAVLKEQTVKGRKYKTIDFILPGQLGFSLLSSGVFGTAFVFISLRLTLVIKRFFATPAHRSTIVIGEALSRLVFSLIGALFIIVIGYYVFGFTLVNGVRTVIDMLILSTLGLMVFMGFGFAVSGIAKNESSVPPIANMITLPQFLLSGTFFSIEAFPSWLQPISRVLPLTYLNDAMRKVAFEGVSLSGVAPEILIITAWGVGIYIVAIKVFKWD